MKVSIGDTIQHEFVVSLSDIAKFDGGVVHKVCATFTLAREIEWCSRRFVLQHKTENEEGIGTQLTIEHRAPAKVGETVRVVAEIVSFERNELLCKYEASVEGKLVATGITGQKILPLEKLKKILE